MIVHLMRRLRRDPLTSAVNIGGLAVALTAVLLMALHIRYETTYDRFLPNADRTYRVTTYWELPGQPPMNHQAVNAAAIKLFGADRAGVEAAARIEYLKTVIDIDGRRFQEDLQLADPNLLDVLRFPIVAGAGPDTALTDPNAFVPTETLARKLFGDADPIGQTALIGGRPVKVTAVLADIPANSHLRTAGFVAESGRAAPWDRPSAEPQSVTLSAHLYVRLPEGADARVIENRVNDEIAKKNPKHPGKEGLRFQAVPDIHLYHTQIEFISPASAPEVLKTLAITGAITLLIAIVNAANLMTTQALKRRREFGMRKAVGADRRRLIVQIMLETWVQAAAAMVMAIALFELAKPTFGTLIGQDLSAAALPRGEVAAFVLTITTLVAFLGGAYPALIVARWRPDDILRGREATGGHTGLRTILVVVQFAGAIALTIATLTVLGQVRHGQSTTLGASPETILIVEMPLWEMDRDTQPNREAIAARMQSLRSEITKLPGILGATLSDIVPTSFSSYLVNIDTLTGSGSPYVNIYAVDPGFIGLYGIKQWVGRMPNDSTVVGSKPKDETTEATETAPIKPVVLTMTALKTLGFADPSAALGYVLSTGTKPIYEVVGVADDIRLRSAREQAEAGLFVVEPTRWHAVSIRLAPGDPRLAVEAIDRLAAQMFPEIKAQRRFLDERLDELYQTEILQGRLFALFSGLAVLLSCAGLFALSALAAAKRTREIGIRRVHGAGAGDILRLLGWQFVKPVLLATVIAWPVSHWAMTHWLEQFAVRVALDPAWFVGSAAGALLIALATVSTRILAVARASPVEALRHE